MARMLGDCSHVDCVRADIIQRRHYQMIDHSTFRCMKRNKTAPISVTIMVNKYSKEIIGESLGAPSWTIKIMRKHWYFDHQRLTRKSNKDSLICNAIHSHRNYSILCQSKKGLRVTMINNLHRAIINRTTIWLQITRINS